MKEDDIAEIRIESTGCLCVSPKATSFPYIYRAGMEVHWDEHGKYLYSPPPREWSYERWLQQIIAAVKSEYGCLLSITSETQWHGVNDTLREILVSAGPKSSMGNSSSRS